MWRWLGGRNLVGSPIPRGTPKPMRSAVKRVPPVVAYTGCPPADSPETSGRCHHGLCHPELAKDPRLDARNEKLDRSFVVPPQDDIDDKILGKHSGPAQAETGWVE